MDSIAARMDFDNAVRIFNNAFNPKTIPNPNGPGMIANPNYIQGWDPVQAFRLCQSTLRLEQPLTIANTNYNFPVLVNIQNQGAPFNTEIRLQLQDSFVPTHVYIGPGFPSGPNDTTWHPVTYPNPFLSANAAAEEAIYSGTMQLQINNVTYTKNWDVLRHRKTNQTQQTAALGAGSPEDQLDSSDDGFYPMQPYVLLIGSQNINLQVILPVAPTAVDANSRLVVIFRGIQAQNSTVVN